MSRKNVVFIGASKFGLRCLEALLELDSVDVTGVITAPEKFSISYNKAGVQNVLHAHVGDVCKKQDIPFVEIREGMKGEALHEQALSWKPDFFVVCGWYHMIPQKWLDETPAYGLHASLLPDYSGGAPLVWALINGERETGITLFQFADGVDNGPVVGQARTDISKEDTIATLYARIEELGIGLVREYVPLLANGQAQLIEQDESKRRLVPQRCPDDGLIDWDQSADKIYDFIRAQTKPYPGAFFKHDGKVVIIWSALPYDLQGDLAPGALLVEGDKLLVGCGGDTALEIRLLGVDGEDYQGSNPPEILLNAVGLNSHG